MTKFMSLELLGLSQTTGKIKNAVYVFEISALVPEKLKLEKQVKYAKLFKFLFLKYLIDFESLFWMKQIQGSVRVKIKEYVHAWSEFIFVSFLVIFNFIPQINHFYQLLVTPLHGLQDVENRCPHLRDIELKTGRRIPYLFFSHVLFSI